MFANLSSCVTDLWNVRKLAAAIVFARKLPSVIYFRRDTLESIYSYSRCDTILFSLSLSLSIAKNKKKFTWTDCLDYNRKFLHSL